MDGEELLEEREVVGAKTDTIVHLIHAFLLLGQQYCFVLRCC